MLFYLLSSHVIRRIMFSQSVNHAHKTPLLHVEVYDTDQLYTVYHPSHIVLSILSFRLVQSQISIPAVHSDWSILPKLLLGFMNLANEINESLSGFWHSLLWPISELELANGSGLTVLKGMQNYRFIRQLVSPSHTHTTAGHLPVRPRTAGSLCPYAWFMTVCVCVSATSFFITLPLFIVGGKL